MYRKSRVGTKYLIEEYVECVVVQLYRLASAEGQERTSLGQRIDYFAELQQSFGRTALVLHGGASFGICHIGVAKCLYEAGMLPRIICGSYIGALMAAMIAVQDEAGLRRLFGKYDPANPPIDLSPFQRTAKGGWSGSWRRKIVRMLKTGRLLDVHVVMECARANFGDLTFKEAFKRSGLILNIFIKSRRRDELPTLLNYLTAPDVVVWSAACASCALLGVYDTVPLMVKDEHGRIIPWSPSIIHTESVETVQ